MAADDSLHLRTEPPARRRRRDAGGGGSSGDLPGRAREDARRVRGGRRAGAALRARRRHRREGRGRLPQQRARAVLLAAAPAGRAARRGAPFEPAAVLRDRGARGDRDRGRRLAAGRPPLRRLRRGGTAQRGGRRGQRVLLPQQGARAAARRLRGRRRRSRHEHGLRAAHARRRARDGVPALLLGARRAVHTLELIAEARPEFLCLDPALVANLGGELTPIEVVQLLVRFSDRIGAQLIATGVRTPSSVPCCSAAAWSCSAASCWRGRTRGCRRCRSRSEAAAPAPSRRGPGVRR